MPCNPAYQPIPADDAFHPGHVRRRRAHGLRQAWLSPHLTWPGRAAVIPGAAAVGYQTLSEAAEHLGVAQSALVIQINRLERDIGGSLLERAERGRPMTPTALGEQGLAALHRTSQPGG
jgi:hypothetical protein